MQKVINYAPYVYACRTSLAEVSTLHVFTLIPVPKSKSVQFFHQSNSGIERGISIEANSLGIHLQAKRQRSELGNRIVSNGHTFWAGYISFDYSGTDNIPEDSFEYSINVHKDDDGQPEKAIKVTFGDVELVSQADFNELKDGDFALACPYAYLYQKEVNDQITFFPQVLIPEVGKYADITIFEANKKEANATLVLPSRMVTSDNITIQVIKSTSQKTSVDVSTSIIDNLLTVDYIPNIKQSERQLSSRSSGQRKKKKMKVRTKPAN